MDLRLNFGITCESLYDVLKDGFEDILQGEFGVGLDDYDLNMENLQKYLLDSPLSTMVVKEKDGKTIVEGCAPFNTTKTPTMKYICNKLDVRDYIERFEPKMPYCPETDEFINYPDSVKLSQAVGGVVFTKANKRKPIKYIYSSIARFLDTLTGNILIVGDPNCTINTRCGGRHWSTPVDDSFSPLEYEYCYNLSDKMIEYVGIESFLNKVHIDHFVYCFSGQHVIEYDGPKCHYLSLLAGTNGIVACDHTGNFELKGRTLTLSSFPRGNVVAHVLLCGNQSDYDSNMIWYTDVANIRKTSSLIPLSSTDSIGKIKDILISDKTDGLAAFLTISNKQAEVVMSEDLNKVIFQFHINFPDQVIICEMVEDNLILCEPLIHPLTLFGDWVNQKFKNFPVTYEGRTLTVRKKAWYQFPLCGSWWKYAVSGEGIVFKNSSCVLGQHSMKYSKLETYYLKLPDRVSYEDRVEVRFEDNEIGRLGGNVNISNNSKKVRKFVGIHNVYKDPMKVYSGSGIYEVLLSTKILFRRRNKDKPDPHWYVVAVSNPPDFKFNVNKNKVESSIFRYQVNECDYLPSDGGVIVFRSSKTEVIPGKIQPIKGTKFISIHGTKFSKLKVGDNFNYLDLRYCVTEVTKLGITARLKVKYKRGNNK